MDEKLKKTEVERVIQKYRFDTIKNLLEKDNDFWPSIIGIKFAAAYDQEKKNKNFQCVYLHHTDSYNPNDYCRNEDEEKQVDIINKSTKIEFGYANECFYITGDTNINVYARRGTPDIPIVFNTKYEAWLDDYEQSELLDGYAENKNIPEWFAISFFKSIKFGRVKITELINSLYFD